MCIASPYLADTMLNFRNPGRLTGQLSGDWNLHLVMHVAADVAD